MNVELKMLLFILVAVIGGILIFSISYSYSEAQKQDELFKTKIDIFKSFTLNTTSNEKIDIINQQCELHFNISGNPYWEQNILGKNAAAENCKYKLTEFFMK